MPPIPIKPMNSPWPIHSGQGGPKVEIERPRPIINEPKITVQRVPTRSAIRAMMMPPVPEPSQASALASAGTERDPPTSLAMSLSATAVIHAAPNDIPMMNSAAEATAQEALVSMEPEGDCNIRRGNSGGESLLRIAQNFTTHVYVGSALRAALRQNARAAEKRFRCRQHDVANPSLPQTCASYR